MYVDVIKSLCPVGHSMHIAHPDVELKLNRQSLSLSLNFACIMSQISFQVKHLFVECIILFCDRVPHGAVASLCPDNVALFIMEW